MIIFQKECWLCTQDSIEYKYVYSTLPNKTLKHVVVPTLPTVHTLLLTSVLPTPISAATVSSATWAWTNLFQNFRYYRYYRYYSTVLQLLKVLHALQVLQVLYVLQVLHVLQILYAVYAGSTWSSATQDTSAIPGTKSTPEGSMYYRYSGTLFFYFIQVHCMKLDNLTIWIKWSATAYINIKWGCNKTNWIESQYVRFGSIESIISLKLLSRSLHFGTFLNIWNNE